MASVINYDIFIHVDELFRLGVQGFGHAAAWQARLLAVDSSAAGPRTFFRSWTAWKPSLQKAGTAGTAKQPRAQRARLQNSRKPKQPTAAEPTAAEPTAWTAWKPSLQKAGTAARRLAPGFRFRFFGGTGYTPSTRRPRGSAAGAASQAVWLLILRLLAPGFFSGHGRRGSRPSKRQEQPEQPNSPGLNAPGYRTADSRRANSRKPKQPTAAEPTARTAWKPSLQKAGTAARLPLISISPPRSVRGGAEIKGPGRALSAVRSTANGGFLADFGGALAPK